MLLLFQCTPVLNCPSMYKVFEDFGLVEQRGKHNLFHRLICETHEMLSAHACRSRGVGRAAGATGKRTVVGHGEILQLICLLVKVIGVDDGNWLLFHDVGVVHVFGRVHLHLVGGGKVVALEGEEVLVTRRGVCGHRSVWVREV